MLQVDGDFAPPPPKVIHNKRMSAQRQLIAVAEKLAQAPPVAPPDKWESFASSVAGDHRTMSDGIQQSIAQKIISDAIFWAKMGRLTERSTVLLVPSPTPSSSHTASPYHFTTLHSPSPSPQSHNSRSNPNPHYYPSQSFQPSEPFNNSSVEASSRELDEFVIFRK